MLRISAETGNRAARLRPASKIISARGAAYRRSQGISTARLRPVQDVRIIRETAQLLVAPLIFRYIAFRSRALHSQNWPDSLRKPN
jgi:hypothetical protein